ncbi:YkgJ family cysteine cluster protein [Acidimangrovimonas sediminis]|uniref:YkgJ family cysteine cluster protein n=1 Tax=Acidimangrovimonas sediminis TaxID=2056283 RepID=UPI000C807B70|nr:YkgJ family cysteine cluster protein [Acidimangrovimonas sediminis]
MTSSALDCLSCGACCFGGHDRYIQLFAEDEARALPADAVAEIDGRRYMRMAGGHCAQLTPCAAGLACGVYEMRPTACRAFRAGSFECLKSRQHRGADAARLLMLAGVGGPDPSGPVPPQRPPRPRAA